MAAGKHVPSYAIDVGLRYLRSKKRATISVISIIAIAGVALGVAALLVVMSITSGFQREFRHKVVGVNAHIMVFKYGRNFDEYRDVVEIAQKMPEVAGAAPFIIGEMMFAKGDRLRGVLVKGIDPKLMVNVLDLPGQLRSGSLEGLRRAGATPPPSPDDEARGAGKDDLDAYLTQLSNRDAEDAAAGADASGARAGEPQPSAAAAPAAPDDLPVVAVPTPEMMEAALAQGGLAALPDDATEAKLIADATPPTAEELVGTESLPGVIVGATLAEELKLKVGDRVKIISPLEGIDLGLIGAGDTPLPKSRDFRVTGVFSAGFNEYDSKLVYIDLYESQAFQNQGDSVIGVEMTLHDIERSADVALRLERELGGGPFRVMDWRELNNNLFTVLEVQQVLVVLVIAIIVVVAAFNVIATLIMIVLEKRREIAILKAMGATDLAVLQIFGVQGAAIGAVGTSIGLAIGAVLCAYLHYFRFPLDPKVYLIDHIPVRTSMTEFTLTVVIALGISVVATLFPSFWAARLLPVDGIRPQ
jgi:lipoprotein-releasing system permease protein